MITQNNTGGRTIQLFIPFDFQGRRIDAITLSPLRLGHVLSWNEGRWKAMIELLVELAGVEENVIRELRYPDADRVMEAFMAMVSPEMRLDIEQGRIPQKPGEQDGIEPTEEQLAELAKSINGSRPATQTSQGPGAPFPPIDQNPGFDLGEEP